MSLPIGQQLSINDLVSTSNIQCLSDILFSPFELNDYDHQFDTFDILTHSINILQIVIIFMNLHLSTKCENHIK